MFCMDNHSMEINLKENRLEVDSLVREFDARLSKRKLVELESETHNLILTSDVDEEKYEISNIENYKIVNFEISGVSVEYNERYGRFFVEKNNEVVKERLIRFLDDYSVKKLPDVGDIAEVIKFDYQDKSYMVKVLEVDAVKEVPWGDETKYDYRGEIVQNDKNNRIGDEIFFYREHVV